VDEVDTDPVPQNRVDPVGLEAGQDPGLEELVGGDYRGRQDDEQGQRPTPAVDGEPRPGTSFGVRFDRVQLMEPPWMLR
jgi:hypothetical protein